LSEWFGQPLRGKNWDLTACTWIAFCEDKVPTEERRRWSRQKSLLVRRHSETPEEIMLIPTQVLEEPENALPGPSRLENEEELQSPVTQEDKWYPGNL